MACDRFAKLLANHSVPTYEYSFEYRGQYSIVNLQGEQVRGVAFLNEMLMLFSVVSTKVSSSFHIIFRNFFGNLSYLGSYPG